uniref:Uncharacterized protein n=1 Tax=Vitis vinifera TaxID=29760 RepID=F6I3V1_VITVI
MAKKQHFLKAFFREKKWERKGEANKETNSR